MRIGQKWTGMDRQEQKRTGKNRSGQDKKEQDRTLQYKNRIGQVCTGQDRANPHNRTDHDRTG